MAAEKIMLRPLIHRSWDYLLETFYTAEASVVYANAEQLHDMMQKVFDGVYHNNGGTFPEKVKFEMDAVNYALARVSEQSLKLLDAGDAELSMIADAFAYRFKSFLTLLEQEDAE